MSFVPGLKAEHKITPGGKKGRGLLRSMGRILAQPSGNAAPLNAGKDDSPAAVTVGERKKGKKARISFLALHEGVDLEVDRWLEWAGSELAEPGLLVGLVVSLVLSLVLVLPLELVGGPGESGEGGGTPESVGEKVGKMGERHDSVGRVCVAVDWLWERLAGGGAS